MKISKQSFTISTSELEGRLDPFYYQEEFLEMQKKLQSINYASISKLSTKVLDGIHKTPKYAENGLIFLQANNINEGAIDFTKNIKYTSDEWREEVLRRYTPKGGDVLITKDGTIGVSATVPNNFEAFSIFVSVLAIRPKQEVIISEFLRIMISSSIVQQQILQSTKGAVISHLLIGEAKKLKIPLPPKKIQTKIIQIMDSAYNIKKEKEEKAKSLLDSIDTYLLEKLDITLPKEEKIVSFEVDSSDVFGGRFDPSYHKVYYKELEKSLDDSRYEVIRLGNITKTIASGSTPKSGGDDYLLNGKNYFLRLVNLDDDLSINTSKALFVNDEIHNGMLKRSQLQKDDLLFGIAGSIGKMAIVDLDIKANINQAIALLRFNNNVNNFFIGFILNSSICKIQIQQLKRPVAQPNLNITELKSLKIPLPPLNIQNEIASHIQALRDEAKQLKQEAKEVLKKAKDEVEEIILNKKIS